MKQLRIYRNIPNEVKDMQVGEIYRMTFKWHMIGVNYPDHDVELIILLKEIRKRNDDIASVNQIKYTVILSRVLNDCDLNVDFYEHYPVGITRSWNVNGDGSCFMKFDEYQDYENYLKTNNICPHQEREEISG
mgnify:CR=1 FL=1